MIQTKQVFFWTSNLRGHGFHGDKATIFSLTSEYYSLYVMSAKRYFLEIGALHQKLWAFKCIMLKTLNSNFLDWEDTWTPFGLGFVQPKKTGRGGGDPPPNLAISSQKTMKLGKGILWLEIFPNLQEFLMMSSSCWFYDVIKMRQLKKISRFSSVFAEYLKNCLTDFHQTYVIFRQLYTEPFEIRRLKIDHSLLP